MTNRSNDDLAAALAGLSGDQPPADDARPTDDPARPPAGPAAPPAARPIPPGPGQRAARPATPTAPPPAETPTAPRTPRPMMPAHLAGPGARPDRPARPAVPTLDRPAGPPTPTRPPAPAARPSSPARPAADAGLFAPPPAAAVPVPDGPPAEPQFATDDDDSVIVPAPPLDYLAHHPGSHAGPAFAPKYQKLEYKRTVIPLLLTAGVCLAAVGVARHLLTPDTPLGALPQWVAYGLFGLAGVSVLFGVLMMLQVKSTLDAKRSAEV